MARKILLVDDDPDVSHIFATIGEHLGYACEHASDGREGIALALSCRPDIIFMDLIMPVIDGVEAIRQIKALPFLAHIPIILCTSALRDPRIADATSAGAAEVLIKPVGMAQLDRTLRTHLAKLGIFYVSRGIESHKRGDMEGALASYDEAIRVNPDDPIAFNNRGSVRRDRGDLGGAVADLNEAIRLRPDYAMAFRNRGVVRAQQGDLDGAIADYTEALRLRPDNVLALNNRSTARRYKGDIDGALADHAQALQLKPDSADAPNNRNVAHQSMQKK